LAAGARRLNRARWTRRAPWIELDAAGAVDLLRPVIGAAEVISLRRVGGGLVHTNLDVKLTGPPGRVLLRLYQRDPDCARKEAALDAMVGGRVPTARFLHFSETSPVTGGPYAALQWIDGVQLDHAAQQADAAELRTLGAAVGDVLARIHAFRFDRAGFFTPDLRVATAIDFDGAGLLRFMHQCLREGPGGERLGAAVTDRLCSFVQREGHRLDAWLGDPRLTHSDCNPSNILVHCDAGRWRVAAMLDWEYALSATPAFDFGNLLRAPLGEQAAFVDGVADEYRAAGGVLPDDWRAVARIADLFAWADLLGRREADVALAADARRAILATLEL